MRDENPDSVIYFIQMGTDGPIKIGKASNVKRRLATLQTAASQPLRILGLASGTVREEAALHDRFAGLRLHGEWFSPGPDLMSYIDAVSIGTEQIGYPSKVTGKPRRLDQAVLRRLQDAADRSDEAEGELRAAVIAADEAGGSVRAIASAARISPTTVQKWVQSGAK